MFSVATTMYAPLRALPRKLSHRGIPQSIPNSNYCRSMFYKLHGDLHERDWLVGVPKVKQHLVHEKGCGKLVPPSRWVGSTRPWNPNLNEHFLFHMQPNDESPGADVAHNWSCNTPPWRRQGWPAPEPLHEWSRPLDPSSPHHVTK